MDAILAEFRRSYEARPTVGVGNIPKGTTQQELDAVLGIYGTVKGIGPEPGKGTTQATIVCADVARADKARAALQAGQAQLGCATLQCKVAMAPATLFVGNLPVGYTDTSLRQLLATAGKAQHSYMVHSLATGTGKGYGLVEFATTGEAAKAKTALQTQTVEGKPVYVDWVNISMDTIEKTQSNKLLVQNLPPLYINSSAPTALFQNFGPVQHCEINAANQSALLTFANWRAAEAAQQGMATAAVGQSVLNAVFAAPGHASTSQKGQAHQAGVQGPATSLAPAVAGIGPGSQAQLPLAGVQPTANTSMWLLGTTGMLPMAGMMGPVPQPMAMLPGQPRPLMVGQYVRYGQPMMWLGPQSRPGFPVQGAVLPGNAMTMGHQIMGPRPTGRGPLNMPFGGFLQASGTTPASWTTPQPLVQNTALPTIAKSGAGQLSVNGPPQLTGLPEAAAGQATMPSTAPPPLSNETALCTSGGGTHGGNTKPFGQPLCSSADNTASKPLMPASVNQTQMWPPGSLPLALPQGQGMQGLIGLPAGHNPISAARAFPPSPAQANQLFGHEGLPQYAPERQTAQPSGMLPPQPPNQMGFQPPQPFNQMGFQQPQPSNQMSFQTQQSSNQVTFQPPHFNAPLGKQPPSQPFSTSGQWAAPGQHLAAPAQDNPQSQPASQSPAGPPGPFMTLPMQPALNATAPGLGSQWNQPLPPTMISQTAPGVQPVAPTPPPAPPGINASQRWSAQSATSTDRQWPANQQGLLIPPPIGGGQPNQSGAPMAQGTEAPGPANDWQGQQSSGLLSAPPIPGTGVDGSYSIKSGLAAPPVPPATWLQPQPALSVEGQSQSAIGVPPPLGVPLDNQSQRQQQFSLAPPQPPALAHTQPAAAGQVPAVAPAFATAPSGGEAGKPLPAGLPPHMAAVQSQGAFGDWAGQGKLTTATTEPQPDSNTSTTPSIDPNAAAWAAWMACWHQAAAAQQAANTPPPSLTVEKPTAQNTSVETAPGKEAVTEPVNKPEPVKTTPPKPQPITFTGLPQRYSVKRESTKGKNSESKKAKS